MATKAPSKTARSSTATPTARAKPQPSVALPKALAAPTKAKAVAKPVAKKASAPLAKKALSTKPAASPALAAKPVGKGAANAVAARPAAKAASAKPKRTAPAKAATPKEISPQGLVKGKHIVCFWKQNDLGLFGRRPDRWIALWEQDPKIEKVLVFETPLSQRVLADWVQRALTLDAASASEYRLLLDQALAKRQGQCDSKKTTYKAFLSPSDKPANNQDYLRWVLQHVKALGIEAPTVVLWPACFANPALVQAMKPCQTITDLVDDQRLFAANAQLVPTITAQYQMWLELSDTVVSNAPGLIAAMGKEFSRPDIAYLSNQALETALAAKASSARRGSAKAAKKRTVVGYAGNLRERLDTKALVQAIHENPDKDFWFVGQTYGSDFYAVAKTLANCKFWGTLRQEAAARVIAQFDVVIDPALHDPLAARMSPHEAQGKNAPLVALGALKGL